MPTIYASAYQRIAKGPSWSRTGSKLGKGRASSMLMFRRRHAAARSEEHTSELQSPCNLVCRLLLEKKKNAKEWNDSLFRTAIGNTFFYSIGATLFQLTLVMCLCVPIDQSFPSQCIVVCVLVLP